MKSALKLFIIGCLVLIFCRCSMNKDSYLKDFEKFITQTEKNCTTLSDPEWEKNTGPVQRLYRKILRTV